MTLIMIYLKDSGVSELSLLFHDFPLSHSTIQKQYVFISIAAFIRKNLKKATKRHFGLIFSFPDLQMVIYWS